MCQNSCLQIMAFYTELKNPNDALLALAVRHEWILGVTNYEKLICIVYHRSTFQVLQNDVWCFFSFLNRFLPEKIIGTVKRANRGIRFCSRVYKSWWITRAGDLLGRLLRQRTRWFPFCMGPAHSGRFGECFLQFFFRLAFPIWMGNIRVYACLWHKESKMLLIDRWLFKRPPQNSLIHLFHLMRVIAEKYEVTAQPLCDRFRASSDITSIIPVLAFSPLSKYL